MPVMFTSLSFSTLSQTIAAGILREIRLKNEAAGFQHDKLIATALDTFQYPGLDLNQ